MKELTRSQLGPGYGPTPAQLEQEWAGLRDLQDQARRYLHRLKQQPRWEPSDVEIFSLSVGLIDTATSDEVLDFARAIIKAYHAKIST